MASFSLGMKPSPKHVIFREESEESNPQVLSGNQINNEEDQEYVASALHCDRLLTCDDGMRRIADAFTQAGYWKGICIHIPPDEADKLDRYFG